jgi:hypothetical protein
MQVCCRQSDLFRCYKVPPLHNPQQYKPELLEAQCGVFAHDRLVTAATGYCSADCCSCWAVSLQLA